jgi:hypothetical protein
VRKAEFLTNPAQNDTLNFVASPTPEKRPSGHKTLAYHLTDFD